MRHFRRHTNALPQRGVRVDGLADVHGVGTHPNRQSESSALHAWKGLHCVTADRLPLLGSFHDGEPRLWICAGMGSRGLSHAPLCTELLAAQWAGEPLPIEAALANALQARRHRGGLHAIRALGGVSPF